MTLNVVTFKPPDYSPPYCAYFCPTFTLEGADECIACANLQDGPYCMSSCPSGVNDGQKGLIFKYPNKEGHCEPCHHNCTQG